MNKPLPADAFYPDSRYTPEGHPRPAIRKVGVLLLNLGTPDSTGYWDMRRYLKEFLWDPRVVEVPRPAWWLVLNLVILNTRPRRSAEAYARIWTDEGSPLMVVSRKQQRSLQAALEQRLDYPVKTVLA